MKIMPYKQDSTTPRLHMYNVLKNKWWDTTKQEVDWHENKLVNQS